MSTVNPRSSVLPAHLVAFLCYRCGQSLGTSLAAVDTAMKAGSVSVGKGTALCHADSKVCAPHLPTAATVAALPGAGVARPDGTVPSPADTLRAAVKKHNGDAFGFYGITINPVGAGYDPARDYSKPGTVKGSDAAPVNPLLPPAPAPVAPAAPTVKATRRPVPSVSAAPFVITPVVAPAPVRITRPTASAPVAPVAPVPVAPAPMTDNGAPVAPTSPGYTVHLLDKDTFVALMISGAIVVTSAHLAGAPNVRFGVKVD